MPFVAGFDIAIRGYQVKAHGRSWRAEDGHFYPTRTKQRTLRLCFFAARQIQPRRRLIIQFISHH